MPIVEPASDTDGSAILQICRRIPHFYQVDFEIVDELWTDFQKNGSGSPYQFCVCRENQDLLGFACYGKHALTESTYDLYWIAVDLRAQGKGVGGALLSYVEEQVLKSGGSKIIIETSSTPPYQAAWNLYQGHGYQQEAVLQDFYAPGDNLLFFTKKLPAN